MSIPCLFITYFLLFQKPIIKMVLIKEEFSNPWLVDQLEDFLYYCCPQCDKKCQLRDEFLKHAIELHTDARELLKKFEDYETSCEIPEPNELFIKEEFIDENYEENTPSDMLVEDSPFIDIGNTKIETDPIDLALDSVQCYKCSEIVDQSLIEDHLKLIHNSTVKGDYGPVRKYQCQECNRALNSLTKHKCKKSLKTVSKKVKSDVKSAKTKPKKDIAAKKETNFNETCHHCPKTFTHPSLMSKHYTKEHSDIPRPWPCNRCDKAYGTRKHLLVHIKSSHDKLFNHFCSYCGKGFFRKNATAIHELKVHNKSKEEEETYDCEHCELTVKGLAQYHAHLKRRHGQIVPTDTKTCEQCGKTFRNIHETKRHQKYSHPTKFELDSVECICNNCDTKFEDSMTLNCHEKECLPKPLKNLNCIYCKTETFHSHVSLKKHSAEKHEKYVHICKVCDAAFESISSCINHEHNLHKVTKRPTHKCPHCDMVFGKKSTMENHAFKVHGDESHSHYKCKHCDYRCRSSCQMKEHVNAIHTKETLYQCQYCDFNTYRKKNLCEHVKQVHEKARPNKCDQCNAGFFYKRDLLNHISRQHPSAE